MDTKNQVSKIFSSNKPRAFSSSKKQTEDPELRFKISRNIQVKNKNKADADHRAKSPDSIFNKLKCPDRTSNGKAGESTHNNAEKY